MDIAASLSVVVNVMAPVFLIAALGFAWNRAKLPYDSAFITTFAINVSSPCLVFSSLTKLTLSGGELLTMTIASVACIAASALLAVPLLLAFKLPLRTYLPALSFPNAGNLGLPLCLFAFGETGLGLGVLFFAVFSVAQFTIGPVTASGTLDLGRLARTPVIYAVAAALAVLLTGVKPPLWVTNTTTLLGNVAVPIMLLSLGVALASLRMNSVLRAGSLSAVRLVLGCAVGVAVADVMGLTGVMRGVVVLQSSMPVAVFNYLWALRYNNAPEEVAGMVLGSTALAFLGLPALLVGVL
ncbi:AEC family transporter [Azospirillum sp. TSO22-1]|uniref:AEC family transporter n=1 Tax=Azospirillum sp. TSO22-1 TaxID=716789 RepID=UPI000D61E724|nr:AEC family transporter [Azospirillum sp. TSO22-1]PWC41709.1 permease [Azospirillum sp. TSO22-1]